jgi:hypothetical protein
MEGVPPVANEPRAVRRMDRPLHRGSRRNRGTSIAGHGYRPSSKRRAAAACVVPYPSIGLLRAASSAATVSRCSVALATFILIM